MFFQGSGAGPARGSGKTASDAAHATLVHPGTEERAGWRSSVDPAPHAPAGDRHTGMCELYQFSHGARRGTRSSKRLFRPSHAWQPLSTRMLVTWHQHRYLIAVPIYQNSWSIIFGPDGQTVTHVITLPKDTNYIPSQETSSFHSRDLQSSFLHCLQTIDPNNCEDLTVIWHWCRIHPCVFEICLFYCFSRKKCIIWMCSPAFLWHLIRPTEAYISSAVGKWALV